MRWEMLARFMINDCIWPAWRQLVLLLQSETIMGLTTLGYSPILILFIFKFTWELRIQLIVFLPTTFHLSLTVNCMPSTCCCLISWSHNTFPDLISNLITALYRAVVLFLLTNWPTIEHHSGPNLFIFFFEFWVLWRPTHHWEVHDLDDPHSERQVHDHGDQQQQQEEIEAALPPAVQAHWVGGVTAWTLEVQRLGGQDELLLGDLQNRQTHKVPIRSNLYWKFL